jgi:hypothetical protein
MKKGGVWLGKRTVGFGEVGGGSGILPDHHVVAVEGIVWHLDKDNGPYYDIVKCSESLTHFNWIKKGEVKNDDVAKLIDLVNGYKN